MKHSLLFVPLISMAADSPSIQFHHSHDELTISIKEAALSSPAAVIHPEEITINMPSEQQPADRTITIASPEWSSLSRRDRMRHICANNKTIFITAGATISASTIAGIVALIVHFTAP